MKDLKFSCAQCGSRSTDAVMMGKGGVGVQSWRAGWNPGPPVPRLPRLFLAWLARAVGGLPRTNAAARCRFAISGVILTDCTAPKARLVHIALASLVTLTGRPRTPVGEVAQVFQRSSRRRCYAPLAARSDGGAALAFLLQTLGGLSHAGRPLCSSGSRSSLGGGATLRLPRSDYRRGTVPKTWAAWREATSRPPPFSIQISPLSISAGCYAPLAALVTRRGCFPLGGWRSQSPAARFLSRSAPRCYAPPAAFCETAEL